ncbi:MAG: sigma-70 family RNA polymerase sigma factor [Phycisphaerales bacterium]|nr:sigma-70 family RNA polymerase sigma factor [Phycisphaerales bacterium]
MPQGGERQQPDDVRLAASGDEAAWSRLVAEYSPRVYALLHSRCRDADLAEEITQAVFASVAEKLPVYSEQGRFGPWVFQIAMNRWRDELRRRQRQRTATAGEGLDRLPVGGGGRSGGGSSEPGGSSESSDYRAKDPAAADALDRALAQLSEADRDVIDLRHVGGLSFKQMADALGEPVGTLLARHHRALGKLRALIESELGRPPE